MKLKYKKHHKLAQFVRNHDTDAGIDLAVVSYKSTDFEDIYLFDTGISVQPDEGYYTQLCERSSMYKQEAHLVNSIGIIDHEYTGNIKAPIACENPKDLIGKRILQLTVHKQPKVELVEVDELSDTQRGSKGFGSSGT